MDHARLRTAVLVLALAATGGAAATELRAGAYYSSNATTEPSGFRCGSFVNGAGGVAECTDSAFYTDTAGGGFFQVDYSSKGSADFGALKTRSSLQFTPGVPDPNAPPGEGGEGGGPLFPVDVRELPAAAQSYGSASLRDTWTVTGAPAGSAGTLRLGYALDGSSTSPSVNGVGVGSSTTLRIRELEMITLPSGTVLTQVKQAGTTYNSGFNGTVDTVVQLELGIVFGQQFILSVLMDSLSSFDLVDAMTPGFATSSEFFNTAMLGDIQVFDATGAPVSFTLTTESGSPVFAQFSTPGAAVPLPATATLYVIGLAGMMWRRRRCRLAPGRLRA